MCNQGNIEFTNTVIEKDETYVVGKPRKDNNHKNNDNNLGKSGNKIGRGTTRLQLLE